MTRAISFVSLHGNSSACRCFVGPPVWTLERNDLLSFCAGFCRITNDDRHGIDVASQNRTGPHRPRTGHEHRHPRQILSGGRHPHGSDRAVPKRNAANRRTIRFALRRRHRTCRRRRRRAQRRRIRRTPPFGLGVGANRIGTTLERGRRRRRRAVLEHRPTTRGVGQPRGRVLRDRPRAVVVRPPRGASGGLSPDRGVGAVRYRHPRPTAGSTVVSEVDAVRASRRIGDAAVTRI